MSSLIVDDVWKTVMRRRMKSIEEFISGLDSEQLVYLVDYAVSEMQVRSDELQKEHSRKERQLWVS